MKQVTKKQRVLDAALHLFVEQGITETSTAQIAKTAGVATGTLFHHFPSKQQLIESLYLDLKQQLVNSLLLDGSIQNQEQAFDVWRKALSWSCDNRLAFSFFTLYYTTPFIEKSFREHALNSVFDFLMQFIKKQIEADCFVAAPTDFIAMHIQQSLMSAANFLIESKKEKQFEEVARLSFDMCFNGIIKRN